MTLISRMVYRLRQKEEGASIIEFALILPILIVLVIGIIEFGWILTGYITITGAAREGARVAAAGELHYEEAVNKHAESMFLQGLSVNSVSLTPGGPGEKSTVVVTGSLPTLIGFFDFIGESYNFTAEATMRQVGYHTAGPPDNSVSDGPVLNPFSNSGSNSSLTLFFDRNIDSVNGLGDNATVSIVGNRVDISFNPAVSNNTTVNIDVVSEGETSSYQLYYQNHTHNWSGP